MTQQYYDPNQQQAYPPQAPPAQYGPPAPNGYAPAPQGYGHLQQYDPNAQPGGYPGQTYGAPQGQPQGPPAPVGARGTVDEFFKQPNVGGGKGISWKNKPDGYMYVGVVNRTPGDNDLFQDSDPNTKALKTWRDSSPKMVMPVPLDLVWMDPWQQTEYADGEGRVFLRSEMLKEVTRAMSEAGLVSGTVPQQGALMYVRITGRKPGRGTIPANQYAVVYLPAGSWENDPNHAWVNDQLAARVGVNQTQAPQQAPYQQQASPAGQYAPQYAVPAGAPPNPQQYAAPQYGAPAAYDPNQAAQSYGGQPVAPTPHHDYSLSGYQTEAGYTPHPQQYAQPDSQPPVAAPAQPAYNPNPQAPVQGQLPGMPPQPPQAPAGVVQGGVVQSQLDPAKQALLAQLQGQQANPAPQQG